MLKFSTFQNFHHFENRPLAKEEMFKVFFLFLALAAFLLSLAELFSNFGKGP